MLNGRLPDSVLGPIAQGRLRKDAARAMNAMNVESKKRYGVTIVPLGGMSAYRTLSQQWYLWRTVRRGWAAYPGTSNHGWGLAIDLRTRQMRGIIDAIGAKYGWAKRWSDAQHEWWHLKWRPGVWNGRTPNARPTLRKGTLRRKWIRLAQRRLRRRGFKSVRLNGRYDWRTRKAVKRLQRAHRLHPDGIVGPRTWSLLLRNRR